MRIREARFSDLRAIAEVAAAAFADEELFGRLMHPHRNEYPEDFITFFEHKFLAHWVDHKRVILVSLGTESGKVVGVADWERQGHGVRKRELANVDPRTIIQPVTSFLTRVSTWMWPNRAADPSKATILEDTFPFLAHYWSGLREENWYLDVLAVHPNYQGRQHRRELVQWGLDEAVKEGVCASVISAYGKEGFYGKRGFREVGRADGGPMVENGIKGGAVMFTNI